MRSAMPHADRRRGRGVRLASRLLLEAPRELSGQAQPRERHHHLGAQLGRPGIGAASGDVEAGRELQQVTLGIGGHLDLVSHVSHGGVLQPLPALDRPAGARTEDPADVAAGVLEGHPWLSNSGTRAMSCSIAATYNSSASKPMSCNCA